MTYRIVTELLGTVFPASGPSGKKVPWQLSITLKRPPQGVVCWDVELIWLHQRSFDNKRADLQSKKWDVGFDPTSWQHPWPAWAERGALLPFVAAEVLAGEAGDAGDAAREHGVDGRARPAGGAHGGGGFFLLKGPEGRILLAID